ncbi:hypothetical protein EGW08_018363 [Elysia chlorotica]|uniref:Uncharacterized protein n=1 Tax=Elysia chlorotica TaxID=188477 RepID=A0A433SX40_ELYCH|nr:hypothetical protein EGW08_018363 [Elysia chlorotica]
MPSNKDLNVFLCVENVDNCDILLHQLGNGEVFGPNQNLRLVLQGFEQNQLEGLGWDVQDCAFPLISGVTTCTTFADSGLNPGAIMVLLSDRMSNGDNQKKSVLNSNSSLSNQDGDHQRFKNVLGLIQYTKSLTTAFDGCSVDNTPIVILGDLANTAASLLSSHVSPSFGASQMIALDGTEAILGETKSTSSKGHMSKAVRFCHALRQWWNGQQAHPDKKTRLGTRFIDNKQLRAKGNSTGYFFSAPVEFSGPAAFSARLDCDIDLSHVAKIKAETDAAHALVAKLGEFQQKQEQSSPCQFAHL